ncbi:TonB-linked outer membrane protein, SusC/RagA family [Pustulibacterium marinum]|uniref:TonB-linked outer membrane protein, SusC/RagA family n=1 Tax=Pustulibacterium marinum TaxID=1224947 RepID=A0A1I7GFD4_9FLAO|nr:TonB-dependent receptor [Pustulibacterium marinum]SFU47113.1 TonB-linked outer membrane protein, SusC/RagA family [Pustulibacterium marinum]
MNHFMIFYERWSSSKLEIRLILLISLLLMAPWASSATSFQQIEVSGIVKSQSDGMPLPGATIMEKGTTNGTQTDFDGEFTLNVSNANAILVISYVGFKKKEISANTNARMEIILEDDFSQLDEVVVVGYGTQKRSDVTGSVTSVPKDRLENLPVTNIAQAIQGTAAGLNVTSGSSVPGSQGAIQIRGLNSISAGTSPLIVVDGTPFYGSLNDINSRDVASIEILKDASSTAIYGTRGSNGVILITTKQGKTGKPTITYSVYGGVEDIPHVLNPMSPEAYVQKYADYLVARGDTQTQILPNSFEVENYEAGITTDWIDEVTRTGVIQEHSLSFSGGTDDAKYFLSGSYLDQKGVIEGYQYNRINLRTNLDLKITDWLTTGMNAFFANNNYDGGRANLLEASAMSPYSVPYDESGEYLIFPMFPELLYENPLLGLTTTRVDHVKNLSGTAYAIVKPWIEGLQYRMNASYYYNPRYNAYYEGRAANNNNGYGYIYNAETNRWLIENILTYNKDIQKHHFDVTLLYSAAETNYQNSNVNGSIFLSDALDYNNIGSAETIGGSSAAYKTNLLSQMARLNYSYDSRYLLTLTARRDGFSAFGANTDKYGLFPSLALGWNLNNENFLKDHEKINQLKLRFSYGKTGNQAVGVNSTISSAGTVLYPFGGSAVTGTYIGGMGNANLKWESTTSANLAVDYGFFQNRISGTLEVYKSETDDLLLSRSIPNITGSSSVIDNIGKVENKGIELTLNTVNINSGDFKWETGLNFSSFRNKIVQLDGTGEDNIANGWFIGESLGTIYTYKMVGVWQEGEDPSAVDPIAVPGDIKFADINGDGQIDSENDRVIQGNTLPDWTGGLTNTFTYKDFTLSVFIQTAQGILKNNTDINYGDEAGRRNVPADFQYWTPENQSNEWPGLNSHLHNRGYSFPRDASYTRIKDVRLSYNVPKSLIEKYNIQNLMVYVAGRNLYTFTDWVGWDPESTQYGRGSGDWANNYPLVRTISLGLNISL